MAITNTHAALLCPPGMGHIIPFLEFAKHLVTHHIIPKVTFFLASIKNSGASQVETQVLHSAMKAKLFDIIQLPSIDITSLVGADASLGTKLVVIMHQIKPVLLSAISTMTTKPTILVTELFGSLALPVAEKLKMSKYVFLPSNAWLLALTLHTPTLDNGVKGQYRDQNKPLTIPGCSPINPSDLFTPLLDRTDQLYHEYLQMCKEIRMADGVFVNTFHELEPKTLAALNSGQISKVPVYPVGPLIRETTENGHEEKRSDVLDWLDKQEQESVIYVSLGSGYTMSYEQIKEMALGLELSGKKFVWSVRPPATKASIDHYLTAGVETQAASVSKFQPSQSLPEEFYRIQTNGVMIMDWAPQLDILKHSSVGGFVSHCGWNSVLESVSCGVPIVGWPLFADQRMNAAMLEEEVGIAVRVEVPLSSNMVGRNEIAKAIRKIMDKEDREGSAMKRRVKELKHIAARAWSQDGSSYRALSEMASGLIKIGHTNGV